MASPSRRMTFADESMQDEKDLPTVAYMMANHASDCDRACVLWRGGRCQQVAVSEVLGRPSVRCVRTLRETLALSAARARS